MLEALAALVTIHVRRRPAVLLLEDWHWADEASRAALEQLAEIAPAHALLIVVTSRPDASLTWATGEHRTVVYLGPLAQAASAEIMRGVLGAARIAPELAQLLHDRTAGNPFFLEETCQALREAGAVVLRDGEAVAEDIAALGELPETVQAVIRTRLDRLQPEARHTLRVASVIGREFTRGILEELAGQGWNGAPPLDQLRRSGLIQQLSVAPEPVYRFKHVLTQEVAYDTLLEHQRQALHATAARAIARHYQLNLDEHLERLAHHYSRAEEWPAAVDHGIRAADRSNSLSQFADALAMLDRTRTWAERFTDEDTRRDALAALLLRQERLCETLGLRARQIAIAEELIALLAPHGGSARLAEAYLRQGDVCTLLRRFDAADRALGTSLRLSAELGNRAGERNALRSIGLLRSHEGRYEEAVTSIDRALELDEELGETAAAAGDVASLGNVLRRMGRQHDALHVLEQALQYLSPHEDTTKWCSVMTVISAAHRDLGNEDRALEYLVRVRDVSVEQRLPIMASFVLPAIAHIQLQRGCTDDALDTYRQAVELSRRARHADGLAQSLRALGEVLFGLERHAESVPYLREAAAVFAQLEDRETETLLWQRAATAHERCGGQLAEAEQLWELVRDRREGEGDSADEALALEGIARCARQRGVRGAAIAHYEHALARAVAAADLPREISLRNTLGLLRWEDGVYPEALRQYEAALRLCRESGDHVHEGLVLNSLGATLLKLRRYDEARTAVEDGVRANARTGERQLEAHSHALLGDVLLAAGRARDARLAFERSLALRPALGDRRGEGWLLERLARALEAEGREDDALVARDASAAIARELQDSALATLLHRTLDPNPTRNSLR
jgi:tetratricopeptide (TPR) repeat protein